MEMTEYGKYGKPRSRLSTLPTFFGNPFGFPHSHGLDCGHVSKVNNKRKARKPDLRPFHRKGLVTDVPGPKCNERSSTLIPSAGLVSLHQRKNAEIASFGFTLLGRALPAGKGPQRCLVEDGKAMHPLLSPATTNNGV
jgi:hypothetical protein